jgi:DNA-binding SARP family transcriptional activator
MDLPSSIAELIDESRALERSGDIGAAFQRAQQAVSLAQASGESEAIAAALNCVATAQFRLGHYEQARALADQALAHAASDSPARARALLLKGSCAGETNSLDEAEAFLYQAADLSRQIGHHTVRAAALHNLSAAVYLPRGQFDLALAADEQARYIISAQNMPELLHLPLITMAWVCQVTGQGPRARAILDELARVAIPGSMAEGYHHFLTASLAQDEGDTAAVPSLYRQARTIAEAVGEPGLNIEVRLGMSRYHRLRDDAPDARAWADDALAIAVRVGYRHLQGKSLVERGHAAWLCGDVASAEADLRAAIEIMTPLRTNLDLARAFFLLAALLHGQRCPEAQSAWLEAASRLASGGYAFLLDRERTLALPLIAACLNDPETERASAALLAHLQHVPPAPLRILTLGRFEVWQGAQQIEKHALSQRRADELLGLLLVSPGHSLSRDQIVEALWPEQEPATAQIRFHHATSSLRRALEPDLPDKFPSRYLDTEMGQVTLRLPPGSSLDLETLEQAIRQKQWQDAIALYYGDLFPNALYADWAVAPRETCAQWYLRALLETARDQQATNRPQEALDTCRRILAREPWQEQAVLIGMQACLALNDRAGALRLYQKLISVLESDLGAEPQEELQALYHALTQPRKKPNA